MRSAVQYSNIDVQYSNMVSLFIVYAICGHSEHIYEMGNKKTTGAIITLTLK